MNDGWLSRQCRLHLMLTGLLGTMVLGGCSSLRGVPVRYQSAPEVVKAVNLTAEDVAKLAVASSRSERNAVQNRAIAVIDLNFNQFVRDLAGDRQDMAATSAGIALGASTAGAFVDSVAAKTNYALLAATSIGAFGIIDRNYYYEKTVPALVAAMGAARSTVLLRIRQAQAQDIARYPGVAALADIEDYFSAGTILAAISQITTSSERQMQATQATVRELSVPTDEEIADLKLVTNAIWSINDASLATANKVLKTLGKSEVATAKEARHELIVFNDPSRPDQIAALAAALKANGLLR